MRVKSRRDFEWNILLNIIGITSTIPGAENQCFTNYMRKVLRSLVYIRTIQQLCFIDITADTLYYIYDK